MKEKINILAIPKPFPWGRVGMDLYPDHLGSTSMVTDYYGNITQSVLYTPFGEVLSEYTRGQWDDYTTDYLFNAKELDEESGMYYYSARYYAPPVFISVDPLADKRPWESPYSYCANNPLRYIDPTGMIVDEASMSEQTKQDITIARKNPEFDKKYQKLVDSKHTYVFNYEERDGNGGDFSTDGEKLYIKYDHNKINDKLGSLSSLFHETEHARQFEDGEIGFRMNRGKWESLFYDIVDEVKARQFGALSPDSSPDQGREYSNLDRAAKKTSFDSKKYKEAYDIWKFMDSPKEGINAPSEPIKNNKFFYNGYNGKKK